MSKERFEGDQAGIPWFGPEGTPTGYVPAFPFGNERDIRAIAKGSGRPVEQVREDIQSRMPASGLTEAEPTIEPGNETS